MRNAMHETRDLKNCYEMEHFQMLALAQPCLTQENHQPKGSKTDLDSPYLLYRTPYNLLIINIYLY